jgi:hypothetical protein
MSLDGGVGQAVAIATAVTITAVPVDHVAVLGINADTLLAACAGALFGLAYTKPETWQRFMALPEGTRAERALCAILRGGGLVFTLACNALLAGWLVEILPHLPMLGWTARIAPQPFAGVLAFVGQFTIPKAIRSIEEWKAPWSRQ